MLILTRRIGETIVINDNITVTVLGVKGNQVRLGFNAPDEVSIHRKEIYEKIQLEKRPILTLARKDHNTNQHTL